MISDRLVSCGVPGPRCSCSGRSTGPSIRWLRLRLYPVCERQLSSTMRQLHQAAERLFVDCAGRAMKVVVDGGIGEFLGSNHSVGDILYKRRYCER
jgi:hypothetical protein